MEKSPFWQDDALCLPLKAKINVFLKKILSGGGSTKETRREEKFQKLLILVFEVIVQPPKHTFEIGIVSMF